MIDYLKILELADAAMKARYPFDAPASADHAIEIIAYAVCEAINHELTTSMKPALMQLAKIVALPDCAEKSALIEQLTKALS